jgi:2-polyprenyl-6-methoxyphenol hydroxylase-like FAD-dependent oxidoreductase
VQRIVIVGAGIGGLCAARAVALAGHEPVVLERSPAGTAIGAGLLLWPDAVHALDALGQGSAVRAVAAPALHTVFRDAAGRTLSEVNVEMLGSRAGAPMLVVERPGPARVACRGVDGALRRRGERSGRAGCDPRRWGAG